MRIVAFLLFGFTLTMNTLANTLPLNGKSTGELSAEFPNLFVPAGVTFAIWGVIYLLLSAWALAQFLPSQRKVAQDIALPWALSNLLNGLWIVAWHYGQVLASVGIMGSLLLVLLRINARLMGRGTEGGFLGVVAGEDRASLLPRMAFGVYLGWISVATIANVTALLVGIGWDGGGIPDHVWARVLVAVGAGAAALSILRLRNAWIGFSVVWAFNGIVIARVAAHVDIALTAALFAGVVATLTLQQLLRPEPGSGLTLSRRLG